MLAYPILFYLFLGVLKVRVFGNLTFWDHGAKNAGIMAWPIYNVSIRSLCAVSAR